MQPYFIFIVISTKNTIWATLHAIEPNIYS